MRKQTNLQAAVTGIAALAASGLAQAIKESEDNHPIMSAQDVSTTGVSINGYVGRVADDDVDYYKFRARAGDVVTIRIDALFGGMEGLYATIGLFGPGSDFPLIDQQTYDYTVDDDPMLKEIRIPADGVYTVGVTNWPRLFADGGINESYSGSSWYGPDYLGDYTLEIKSAAPSFVPVNIEMDPDDSGPRMLNPMANSPMWRAPSSESRILLSAFVLLALAPTILPFSNSRWMLSKAIPR